MIANKKEIIDYLLEQDIDKLFELKEFRHKRSLNANSYAWELIGQIADIQNASKEEIYLIELKRYGQQMIIPVVPGSKPDGYFKYYEFLEEGIINGKECEWYKVFKGSSEYNTLEMSILIDGVVHECTNLGIPTINDDELERLKGSWKNEKR
jgi:hypothetical protein